MRLLVALALTVGLPAVAAAGEDFGQLTLDQVEAKLKQKDVFVFDCNSKSDFLGGHLPTAKWVDYDKVTAKDLPGDKNATLIFYCANTH